MLRQPDFEGKSWKEVGPGATFGNKFGVTLLLDAEVFDYDDTIDKEGFIITVTHPKDYPLTSKNGFVVSPG